MGKTSGWASLQRAIKDDRASTGLCVVLLRRAELEGGDGCCHTGDFKATWTLPDHVGVLFPSTLGGMGTSCVFVFPWVCIPTDRPNGAVPSCRAPRRMRSSILSAGPISSFQSARCISSITSAESYCPEAMALYTSSATALKGGGVGAASPSGEGGGAHRPGQWRVGWDAGCGEITQGRTCGL